MVSNIVFSDMLVSIKAVKVISTGAVQRETSAAGTQPTSSGLCVS